MTEPIQQAQPTRPARSPRRASSARWLAFVIALMLFPRASETIADVGHLLLTGHTSDVSAPDHEPHDGTDEHGCSGLFHTCRCCATPPVIAVASSPLPQRNAPGRASASPAAASDAARDGHREPPFRPPAA